MAGMLFVGMKNNGNRRSKVVAVIQGGQGRVGGMKNSPIHIQSLKKATGIPILVLLVGKKVFFGGNLETNEAFPSY